MESFEKNGVTKKLFEDFDGFVKIAKKHFRDEEQYLKEINFPALEDHKKSHEKLTKILRNFRQKIAKEKNDLSDTMRFMIKSWLVTHVLREDGDYKRFQTQSAKSA